METTDTSTDRVSNPVSRRHLLEMFAALGALSAVGLAGCASDGNETGAASSGASSTSTTSTSTTNAATTSTAPAATTTACTVIPEETAGPYPGDGSNGVDVLGQTGIVRRDIRSSFGSSSSVAAGVPMTIELTVLDAGNGCAPLSGAAVYVWHCDQEGRYSLYSNGVTGENYLRGVQTTGTDGTVSFTSIFPACYSGRWPHIHFEVYPGVDQATSASGKLATSQIALPQNVCEVVYATSGYSQSVTNLAQVSLTSDNVFADDGAVHELAAVSGDATKGYVVALTVPVLT